MLFQERAASRLCFVPVESLPYAYLQLLNLRIVFFCRRMMLRMRCHQLATTPGDDVNC